MVFAGLGDVLKGVLHVPMGHLRLMRRVRKVLLLVMLRSLAMVLRGAVVMLGGRAMVFCSLVTRTHETLLLSLIVTSDTRNGRRMDVEAGDSCRVREPDPACRRRFPIASVHPGLAGGLK